MIEYLGRREKVEEKRRRRRRRSKRGRESNGN
jgi:hypothetical protein